jgi:hypothetical protein
MSLLDRTTRLVAGRPGIVLVRLALVTVELTSIDILHRGDEPTPTRSRSSTSNERRSWPDGDAASEGIDR